MSKLDLESLDVRVGKQVMRGKIQEFEDELLKHPQVELELIQHFCAGVYLRELHIPAGILLSGKIHKFPCLNIVPVGDIEVVTEQGIKRIQGPAVFTSPAGVKRAARTFRDTIWITVHANPDNLERDSAAMADLLTVPSYELLESHSSKVESEQD